MPGPPQTAATFNLPLIAVSASNLQLTACNRPAAKLLCVEWDDSTPPAVSAAPILRRRTSEGAATAGDADVKDMLQRLAEQCDGLEWGQSVVLDYQVQGQDGPTNHKAEAVVSFSPRGGDGGDGAYSILFLRPAVLLLSPSLPPVRPADLASMPSPTTTISSTSLADPVFAPVSTSSSVSSLLAHSTNSAVFSSSTAPSEQAQVLDAAGLHRTAAAVSSSASISSGSGSSSSSKRPHRTPTGQDRRNLPIPPDITQMLMHATNPITDRTSTLSPVPSSPGYHATSPPPHPSSTLSSIMGSPVVGSPIPSHSSASSLSSTRPPLTSTALVSPPPSSAHLSHARSGSGANARRSSFDARFEHLVRKVDASSATGSMNHYRMPVDEAEARLPSPSPTAEKEDPLQALYRDKKKDQDQDRTPPRSSAVSVGESEGRGEVQSDSRSREREEARSWEAPSNPDLPIVGKSASILAGRRRPDDFVNDPQARLPRQTDGEAAVDEVQEKLEGVALADEPEKDEKEEAAKPTAEAAPVVQDGELPSEGAEKPTDGSDLIVEPRLERRPLTFDELTNCIETVPQIIFIADPDGQVLWLNHSWYRYTGYDPDYAMSFSDWLAMFHSDDLVQAFPTYLGAMKTGNDFWFEYRVKGADGQLRWHMCQGRAFRDRQTGEIQQWYCTITNVEELVTTRHDALLIKERTQAVLEGSNLVLLSVDTKGRITFCEGQRPSAHRTAGDEPLIGRQFSELWPDEELNEAVRRVLDEEVDGVQMQTEADLGTDGKHYHRYRLVPLRGDPSIPSSHPDATAITGVIIVGTDVTELVLAEKELARAQAERTKLEASEFAAREANRLKTEFMTTISHEIRSPITAILGICELLLTDTNVNDEQRELVDKAVRSGEILLDLVGAVLDVRKVEAGELVLEASPLRIDDVLLDARLFSVIAQKKGLAFVEDIGPFYEGVLLGDRLRLRQVLANALSNAVKFTSEGSISLRLHQLEETDTSVVLEIVVADTGIGIARDVLPTLFVPFRQADASTARQYGGSGLGLTIAKKLIELMGGAVSLSSDFGSGTHMTIRVPLQKAPLLDVVDYVGTTHAVPAKSPTQEQEIVARVKSVEEVRKRRDPHDVRILLAEDNELIREIVVRTLRVRKFHIDAVEDGHQCVLQVEKERYDVILMDGQMPRLDGYAATERIRKHENPRIRNLRIIALTASAIAGDRERCLAAGMNSYLAKPVRANELEAAIWAEVEQVSPSPQLSPISPPTQL
ncbi:hypothetical protein JCM10207_008548 [Rhodosporidiobolus poonsookiae]